MPPTFTEGRSERRGQGRTNQGIGGSGSGDEGLLKGSNFEGEEGISWVLSSRLTPLLELSRSRERL